MLYSQLQDFNIKTHLEMEGEDVVINRALRTVLGMEQHSCLKHRERICVFYIFGKLQPVFIRDKTEGHRNLIRTSGRLRSSNNLCQLVDGLVQEQLFHGYFQTSLASQRAHLNTANRVAAKLKEIIVNADALDSDDL